MEKLYKDQKIVKKIAREMDCSVIAVEKRATRHNWSTQSLVTQRRELNGKSRKGVDVGEKGRQPTMNKCLRCI